MLTYKMLYNNLIYTVYSSCHEFERVFLSTLSDLAMLGEACWSNGKLRARGRSLNSHSNKLNCCIFEKRRFTFARSDPDYVIQVTKTLIYLSNLFQHGLFAAMEGQI